MRKAEMKRFEKLLVKMRHQVLGQVNQLERNNISKSQRDSSGDLSSYAYHMADLASAKRVAMQELSVEHDPRPDSPPNVDHHQVLGLAPVPAKGVLCQGSHLAVIGHIHRQIVAFL